MTDFRESKDKLRIVIWQKHNFVLPKSYHEYILNMILAFPFIFEENWEMIQCQQPIDRLTDLSEKGV